MTPIILVAEDDIISAKVVARALSEIPCSVIRASNGKRAWEILLDNPDISLLITDMKMPDMDGRSLIQAVRGDPIVANVPIIIVSGMVMPREISDLLLLGCSRFLPKPVNAAHLKQYTLELLNRGSASVTASRHSPKLVSTGA